jgi:hypothetical protein
VLNSSDLSGGFSSAYLPGASVRPNRAATASNCSKLIHLLTSTLPFCSLPYRHNQRENE